MTIFITRDENCPYFEEFCQFVYEETGANVKVVEEGDRRSWEARPLINELFNRWCGMSH